MSSTQFARSALMRVCTLEDRTVPASFGNPWPDAQNLTISFAPDGTDVAGEKSTLQADLSRSVGADWKVEILKAFQAWAATTNVNVSVVTDDGTPFGVAAPPQGSTKFGDIRIASRPLGAGVLALGTPFDLLGSSWAGDVMLNSATPFSKGGANGTFDLATVMMHEAGHVFGLGGEGVAAGDVMTEHYQGVVPVSVNDASRLQGLYDGVRKADRFDAKEANATQSKASELTFASDTAQWKTIDPSSPDKPFVAAGDLGPGEVDWYKAKAPSGTSDFEVHLRTSNVSLLQAKISVYDGTRLLKTVTAANPVSGDIWVKVEGAVSGRTYTVKVEAAPCAGIFGIGSYKLSIGKEAKAAVFPSTTSGFVNADGRTNESIDKATSLTGRTDEAGPGWNYTVRASVEVPGDKDYYKIRATTQSFDTMLVTVYATEFNKLNPKLQVFDSDKRLVATGKVISNDGILVVVEFSGIDTKKDYFVEVSAVDPTNSFKEGNYVLAVDYRNGAQTADVIGTGRLTSSSPAEASLALEQTRVVRFGLTSLPGGGTATLTILDATNRAVATVSAKGGETVTRDLLLNPGTYTFRVQRSAGSAVTEFSLTMLVRNDPLGPIAIDPTAMPGSMPTTQYVPPPSYVSSPPAPTTTSTVGPTTYYYVSPYAPRPLYSTTPLTQLWIDPTASPFM